MSNLRIPQMATKKNSKLPVWRLPWLYLGLLGLLALGVFALYQNPGMRERLDYHYDQARAKVFYFFRRPQEKIFLPGQAGTQAAGLPTAMPTIDSTLATATPAQTNAQKTKTPSATTATEIPEKTQAPLPQVFQISDIAYEKQGMNNCGPTTLGIYLRYWGIDTDQVTIADVVHQIADDRNVGLYEMRDYVLEQTQLKAIIRHGGDFDLLRRLVSQGFPVMLERGFYTASTSEWMGHYGLVTGFDQKAGTLHVPDTYLGETDFKDADLERLWMHFAYAYLLIYPEEQEATIQAILGAQWDEAENARHTLELMREKAKVDFADIHAEDKFFARFGVGMAAMLTQDPAQAAEAFDEAFGAYSQLPSYKRPFRVMWYQFGPYEAYYATGRFEDCLSLAQNTIANSAASGLEESWYWRGRCVEGLGDANSAAFFYKKALEWHPGWLPAQEALQALEQKP